MVKFVVGLFTIKKIPKRSEIKADKRTESKALIAVTLGLFLLFASITFAIYKVFYFNSLKLEVGEFIFSFLMLGLISALISGVIAFVSLLNFYTNVLVGFKESKFKRSGLTLLSLSFSVYMSFLSVNEVGLLGKYNELAYQQVCKIYVVNGKKSDICIQYEKDMETDTSLKSRILNFY